MALVNPNIAMGYRGVEIPNQLAQYAQLSAIQNAQQANQLNQLKMDEYQLEKQNKNALSAAYAQSFDPTSGKVDYNKLTGLLAQGGQGVNIPSVLKQRTEDEKAATEEAARRAKLMADTQAMYQNMTGQIRNKADAATFLQRMVNDPALKDSPLARIPLMEQVQRIPEDPQGLDNWVKQFSLGATKYITENKPVTFSQDTGAGGRVMSRPGLGGAATVVPGSEFTKTATIGDRTAQAQLSLAREKFNFDKMNEGQSVTYQQDANNNIVALPTKVRPGDVPRARTVAAPGAGMLPMEGKPSEAAAKETASLNQQKAIVAGALDAIKKNPTAFGTARGLAGGLLGETFGSRIVGETPEETEARSFLFNVVSGVIKERAGTAQSAGEQATLNRFLPTTTDDDKELTAKLKGFQNYLSARESAGKKPGNTLPLAPIDQQALEWANSNPADPRAAVIKQRLGR